MKDIVFNVGIILDSVSLLDGGACLPTEVSVALAQRDESSENLAEKVREALEDENGGALDVQLSEAVNDAVLECQIETLMKHIVIQKDDVSFDYIEAANLDDRSLAPFRVPCKLRMERFLREILESDTFSALKSSLEK